MQLGNDDFDKLKSTVSIYEPNAIINALDNCINLYLELRKDVFNSAVKLDTEVQEMSLDYLNEIKDRHN